MNEFQVLRKVVLAEKRSFLQVTSATQQMIVRLHVRIIGRHLPTECTE